MKAFLPNENKNISMFALLALTFFPFLYKNAFAAYCFLSFFLEENNRNAQCVCIRTLLTLMSHRPPHRLKILSQEYKTRKQEAFPSGQSKVSSLRSQVLSQVSTVSEFTSQYIFSKVSCTCAVSLITDAWGQLAESVKQT